MDDTRVEPPVRIRCEACFKQFQDMSRLVQHMAKAGHSQHELKCGFCNKHCKCFEALREHLLGPLCKKECAKAFSETGCKFCLDFVGRQVSDAVHRLTCRGATSNCRDLVRPSGVSYGGGRLSAVALDCEMVGGGEDGSVNMCARICMVDEQENVLLNTFVRPSQPVTDYRYDITGIEKADLVDAMPLAEARRRVFAILQGSQHPGQATNGFSKLLVGHSLHHDLRALDLFYPADMTRDTGCYPPLLKTSGYPHKLRDITSVYLGYQIQQEGSHDPFEDAVSAMRLYLWIRSRSHVSGAGADLESSKVDIFSAWDLKSLESLSPRDLLQQSRPFYKCWCLDNRDHGCTFS